MLNALHNRLERTLSHPDRLDANKRKIIEPDVITGRVTHTQTNTHRRATTTTCVRQFQFASSSVLQPPPPPPSSAVVDPPPLRSRPQRNHCLTCAARNCLLQASCASHPFNMPTRHTHTYKFYTLCHRARATTTTRVERASEHVIKC